MQKIMQNLTLNPYLKNKLKKPETWNPRWGNWNKNKNKNQTLNSKDEIKTSLVDCASAKIVGTIKDVNSSYFFWVC